MKSSGAVFTPGPVSITLKSSRCATLEKPRAIPLYT
jgi:hypothetical protein